MKEIFIFHASRETCCNKSLLHSFFPLAPPFASRAGKFVSGVCLTPFRFAFSSVCRFYFSLFACEPLKSRVEWASKRWLLRTISRELLTAHLCSAFAPRYIRLAKINFLMFNNKRGSGNILVVRKKSSSNHLSVKQFVFTSYVRVSLQ